MCLPSGLAWVNALRIVGCNNPLVAKASPARMVSRPGPAGQPAASFAEDGHQSGEIPRRGTRVDQDVGSTCRDHHVAVGVRPNRRGKRARLASSANHLIARYIERNLWSAAMPLPGNSPSIPARVGRCRCSPIHRRRRPSRRLPGDKQRRRAGCRQSQHRPIRRITAHRG